MINESFGISQHWYKRALHHLIRTTEKSNIERKIVVTQQINKQTRDKEEYISLIVQEYYHELLNERILILQKLVTNRFYITNRKKNKEIIETFAMSVLQNNHWHCIFESEYMCKRIITTFTILIEIRSSKISPLINIYFCVSSVLLVFLIKVFSIAYKTQSRPLPRLVRFIKYIDVCEESDLKWNFIWEKTLHFSEEF